MPRRRLEARQPSFASGLIPDQSIFTDVGAMPNDSVVEALYCSITREGAIRKQQGSRRIHATAIDGGVRINGGFSWRRGSGTIQQLVTTDNLFTGTYSVGMSWTSQVGALDNTKRHSFASFRDGSGEVVYIADGGLLNKWNAAAVTIDIASTPSVSQLAVYNQRLFGIAGNNENLYWSGLNNGDTLGVAASGGGVAIVRTFGGQNLTGLAAVGSSLLLFHANAISRFSGYTQTDIDIDAGVVGQAQGVGTLAPRSIVVIDDDGRDVALFLTTRGLYAATESSTDRITTPFDRFLSQIGSANWDLAHAVHNPLSREVLFVVPGFTSWIYNYEHKAWTRGFPYGVDSVGTPIAGGSSVLWTATDDLGAPVVLSGGYDGFVRRFDYPELCKEDVLSDGSGGNAYSMVLIFAPWFFGDETLDKSLRHLYLTGQGDGAPAAITVGWTTSADAGGSTIAVTVPATYGTVAIPWWGNGTWARVSVIDPSTTPTLYARARGEAFALGRRRSA